MISFTDLGQWITSNANQISAVANAIVAVTALLAAFYAILAHRIASETKLEQIRSADEERIHTLTGRLYELDRMIMDSPETARLVDEYSQSEEYFTLQRQQDNSTFEEYYKVRGFILFQINLFDEIFCLMSDDPVLQAQFEFEDWKKFILKQMAKPLFKELLRKENVWGDRFNRFCRHHGLLQDPPQQASHQLGPPHSPHAGEMAAKAAPWQRIAGSNRPEAELRN
jgi:hypothetical protein